jgi:cytochrome P450
MYWLDIDDAIAEKIIHTDNLPKHKETYDILLPILGKTSIITVPTDDYWRNIRKMFNPGFAISHLETSVPGIVEESMVFVKILEEAAQNGSIVQLGDTLQVITQVKKLIVRQALTIDVIAR